jgi:hypothetical protein
MIQAREPGALLRLVLSCKRPHNNPDHLMSCRLDDSDEEEAGSGPAGAYGRPYLQLSYLIHVNALLLRWQGGEGCGLCGSQKI